MSPSPISAGGIVIIEIRQGDDRVTIGILADAVTEVVDLDPARITTAPGWGDRRGGGMMEGIYAREGGFFVLLGIDKALAEEPAVA
jgi:purine-binding chemotaxis protein CheW